MTTPRRWWPSTIRVRLTLLYAGAFFLAGVTLVALMHLYVGQVLNHRLTVRGDITHLSPEAHDALRVQLQRARDDTLNTMLIASLILLGVVGVIAGGFGWLLAGRALHPLRQITATARRVADRSLHERIALVGPNDEIKDLADTLDAMLERLDRNPQANESLRQLGATLLAVNQRHERLIDGLLTLASSEQGVTERTPVDLADIARHITTGSQGAA